LLNRRLVRNQIAQIREACSRLRVLLERDEGHVSEKSDAKLATERLLQIACEATFDIGRHIVARKALGVPGSYTEVITCLRSGGVVGPDLAEWLVGAARMRNRLVHVYWDLTEDEIGEFAHEGLSRFEGFCKIVLEILETEPQ
jgi:uncharacterized protein YutE (UPF0331/DUF86 family)